MGDPPQSPTEYRDELSRFSCGDLLAKLGGLQLLAVNSNRLARLEYSSQLAMGARFDATGADVQTGWLQAWLAASPFAYLDDPLNGLFAEEAVFYGGSYVVFPGLLEESLFVFRHLVAGTFHGDPWPAGTLFAPRVTRLAGAVLRLSNEVARRAGLTRGVRGEFTDEVVIPGAELAALASAVTFEKAELETLLSDQGGCSALDPLVQEPKPAPEGVDIGIGAFKPLVTLESQLVVAQPHELLGALDHAIVCAAIDEGLGNELAERYRNAVFDTMVNRLRFQGPRRLKVSLPPLPEKSPLVEAVLELDTDKFIHLLLVCDDLSNYGTGSSPGDWERPQLSDEVQQRVTEVEADLLTSYPGLSGLLHLVLIQGVGRAGPSLREPRVRDGSRCLALQASDLEVICLLDHNQIALWKYATAGDHFRESTAAIAISPLDEFQFYREKHYYLSDEARPDLVHLPYGGGADLRAELHDRFDFHGALFPDDSYGLVVRVHDDPSVPIYAPFAMGQKLPAMLVEGLDAPVWVVSAGAPTSQYVSVRAQFVDLVAYWLWQLTEDLRAQVFPAGGSTLRLVELELVPNEAWFTGTDIPDEPPFVVEVVGADRLRIVVTASAAASCAGPTNAGERDFLTCILGKIDLQANGTPKLSSEEMTEVIDRVAPLGPKKKITVYNVAAEPRLDTSGLPSYRSVQKADEELLLDELGEHLSESRQVGPIPPSEANNALKEAVSFYLERLERTVATIDPAGLLEWLVAHHERIVAQQTSRELAVPTELACFGTVTSVAEQLKEEIPNLVQTAIASRFLIEYVVARPPTGDRPMSRSLYDELLALCSEITTKGLGSDMVHYELSKLDLSITASHRLGTGRGGAWELGRDEWLKVHSQAEIERRSRRFKRLFSDPSGGERPAELDELDAAVKKEFGFTLTSLLEFLFEVANAGYRREGEPKAALKSELIDELAGKLGWESAEVERAVALFSLESRDEFQKPAGYKESDVYPWRFNRALSYIRRPLLIRRSETGEEVVWGTRHINAANENFFAMCLGGRIGPRSKAMKDAVGRIRSRKATEFNDHVARLFDDQADSEVRVRVKKVGKLRIAASGEDISDIDVLVAQKAKRRLLVVETKDLAVARTPAELSNEMSATFKGTPNKPSALDRLLEVVDWVRKHLPETLAFLGIDEAESESWSVEPLIVVDRELLSPFITSLSVEVLSQHELSAKLERDEL